MPAALSLAAPAKVNLSLAVVGRRADGLHELAGVLVLVGLHDTLRLVPGAPGLRVVAAPGEPVPADREANLAWRGLLAGAAGRRPGCLELVKRIPAASGLGGGSSDAAAAWRLARHPAPAGGRAAAALLAIGADVPFFASGHAAAYVTGAGERVAPLPARDGEVVIALPAFRLSTAAVFAELRRGDWSAAPAPVTEPGRNDLLAPARRLRPEIDALFGAVRRAGGEPRLTGSGPAVFAIGDDPEQSAAVARGLRAAGVRVIETRLRLEAPSIEEEES